MKKVLCLGAGLVARPFIHYLSEHGIHVVVASRTKSKAENLIEGCENAEAVAFNIATDDKHYDCVELLVKHGADCNVKDRWGKSPLDKAQELNDSKLSILLQMTFFLMN